MASENVRQDTRGEEDYEYIIVGSGPGGGPLAANLARHGHKVLLLEAGDDQGQNIKEKVPAMFAAFEEDPVERWDFFVKHYADENQQAKDPKLTWETPDGGVFTGIDPPAGSKQLGVWYPRAGTLGGCAAHNGLVAVLPPNSDWDHIAHITGDSSWRSPEIRRLFKRMERCQYLAEGHPAHGFDGWLETNLADNSSLEAAEPVIKAAVAVSNEEHTQNDGRDGLIRDINGINPERRDGVYRPAMTMTSNGRRASPRNYLVATSNAKDRYGCKKYPLYIKTHCLATRILFDDHHHHNEPKAIGIEYLEGESIYKADPRFNANNRGIKKRAFATKEVIIACGVFNTPQLLKLSGIGPAAELESLGIDVVVDLPGVGNNLQDNYEFGVVVQAQTILSGFNGGTGLTAGDPLFKQWVASGGPYASNGIPATVLHTSSVADSDPDLMLFGGALNFTGFFPGFSQAAFSLDHFTWDILKIRPRNTSGTVKLSSADPRDVPVIEFNYFDEGGKEDLEAMYEGVELARRIYKRVTGPAAPLQETEPGESAHTKTQIKQSIKNAAFGHHASCTVSIGADDDRMACLDSRFRVRGVKGLRVVDASSFPRVPGAFPTLATCILSEKATDVILEDSVQINDDKVLEGVRELEVLVEDVFDNKIVFEQAHLQEDSGSSSIPSKSGYANGNGAKRRRLD